MTFFNEFQNFQKFDPKNHLKTLKWLILCEIYFFGRNFLCIMKVPVNSFLTIYNMTIFDDFQFSMDWTRYPKSPNPPKAPKMPKGGPKNYPPMIF